MLVLMLQHQTNTPFTYLRRVPHLLFSHRSILSRIGASEKSGAVQMVENAEAMGANGIVAFRYDATTIMTYGTEFLCYGTAVVVEKV
ncbi:MAG: hypothetical protein CMP06_08335 [Xanthomonadales bacterium]|nr:hypothetical protein [Xanthomonadales bacterium]